MGESQPPDASKNTLDQLLAIMMEARAAAMRARKAVVQKEFMIARRMLEQAYDDYEPEELPVDLSRLKKDITITRDRRIDELCAEVDEAFAVTNRVLSQVASAHPDLYMGAMDAASVRRRRLVPAAKRKRVAKQKPELDIEAKRAVVERIRQAKTAGVTLFRLSRDLGLEVSTRRPALISFLHVLRDTQVVQLVGQGKGACYRATKALGKYEQSLSEG